MSLLHVLADNLDRSIRNYITVSALTMIPLAVVSADETSRHASRLPPQHAPTGGKMTFDEEFDRLPSKLTSTTYWWGGRWLNGQGEQEVYVDPSYQGSAAQPLGLNPFSVTSGVLQIQALVPSSAILPYLEGQKYPSGLLTSYNTFSQLYGYFEVRARIPAGKGFWPTFWLLPKVNMPTPPEIDVLEAQGDKLTDLVLTVHYNNNKAQKAAFHIAVPDISAAFHRYGMLWTRDYVAWYFDGNQVASTPTPADMHSPMYLLLNLAVGGTWVGQPDGSTPFPGNFLIDYIRVYPAG